jgi:nucleoside 2-deoxyribosyltransferase
MKEKLIYLAGAMTYYEKIQELSNAIKWRQQVEDLLSDCAIKVYDPTNNYTQNKTYDVKGVPYQNLYYLQNCDLIILNMEYIEHSPGTLFEIFLGWYLKKPIISFGYSRLLEQPHIKESITIHFDTLEDCTDYVKSMYLQ